MTVIKSEKVPHSNQSTSAKTSGNDQFFFDPYDLSSKDEEYLRAKSIAEITPGRSDCTPCGMTAARHYLNSRPDVPINWEKLNLNLNDYKSDSMEISSTFWLLDITDWCCQQEETHSKYADISNVSQNIISPILSGVGVEASIALGRDSTGRRQSLITCKTLEANVILRQLIRANNGILAGD